MVSYRYAFVRSFVVMHLFCFACVRFGSAVLFGLVRFGWMDGHEIFKSWRFRLFICQKVRHFISIDRSPIHDNGFANYYPNRYDMIPYIQLAYIYPNGFKIAATKKKRMNVRIDTFKSGNLHLAFLLTFVVIQKI